VTLVVRAPASSANLGAGFDVFGMAIGLYAEVGHGPELAGAHWLDPNSRMLTLYRDLGGATDALWLRTNIPMGRGLGFSGAVRVAVAGLAAAEAGPLDADARRAVLAVATSHEGHGDNAAASVYGGVVAYVGPGVVPIPVGPRMAAAAFVAWVPEEPTLTRDSRAMLSAMVERSAAVHNIARAVQFAVAISTDEPGLLRGATDDRLHQDGRLAGIRGGAEALAAGVDAGAWAGWVSGSGPTIGFLCGERSVAHVVAALDAAGADAGVAAHVKVLHVDPRGVRVVDSADVDR
jgi:homoserine kinase